MIGTLIAFFRLIRINNLLMMTGTQVLTYFFLTDYLIAEDLLRGRFALLLIATFLTAASGYIINDYIDVKIDITNKPDKVVVGHQISRRMAMLLHLLFNVVAFYLGLIINWKLAFSIVLCSVFLWFYSVVFKRLFLTGNLLIAFLSAYVLLILKLFDNGVSGYLIWAYAFFAFAITLIREIIKDAEDLRGDSKFDCKTLPIVLGVRKTKSILITLTGLFAALLFLHVLAGQALIPFRHGYAAAAYIFYILLFVIVPLLLMIYLLRMADTKKDFTRLSSLSKLIMLAGMLSMMVIKI